MSGVLKASVGVTNIWQNRLVRFLGLSCSGTTLFIKSALVIIPICTVGKRIGYL